MLRQGQLINGAETYDLLLVCFEYGRQAQRSHDGLIACFAYQVARRAGECSSSDRMWLETLDLDLVLPMARLGEVVGGL